MKILVMVLVWAIIFATGFVLPRFIAPTGDGFTRGMNRLPYFLGLHCLGLLTAIVTAGMTLRAKADIAGWLLLTGFIPLAAYFLMIGLFVVVYAGGM